MPQEKKRNRAGDQPKDKLPPIAKKVEDAVGETPRETVSGDPAYAPDADYAAMQDDEVQRKGRNG